MKTLKRFVAAAADAKAELLALQNPADKRLTREVYRELAVRNAKMTGEEEDTAPLFLRLEQHPEFESVIKPGLLRLQKVIRDWPGRPPRRLGGYATQALEAALASQQLHLHHLFVAAIDTAPNSYFGSVQDPDGHEKRVEALRRKLADLCAQIEDAWSPNDVTIEDAQEAGLVRVRFQQWPAVTLGSDFPTQLIDAELAQRAKQRAA